MKKLFCMLVSMILVLSLATTGFAVSNTTFTEIIHENDGSELIVTTTISALRSRAGGYEGSKKATCKVDGKIVWTYSIHATFSSTGKALTVGDTYDIKDQSWSFSNSSTSKSGYTASGKATFSSGSVKKSASLKLTCDANGNIK